MKHIEVVAAIIIKGDKILCVQRGENKLEYISRKYEFPGGKLEAGETEEEGLKREISEELKILIEIERNFLSVTHKYPDFILTMHSFICTCDNTQPTLTEHLDFKWLEKDELKALDWAAADIPIVDKLIETL